MLSKAVPLIFAIPDIFFDQHFLLTEEQRLFIYLFFAAYAKLERYHIYCQYFKRTNTI